MSSFTTGMMMKQAMTTVGRSFTFFLLHFLTLSYTFLHFPTLFYTFSHFHTLFSYFHTLSNTFLHFPKIGAESLLVDFHTLGRPLAGSCDK